MDLLTIQAGYPLSTPHILLYIIYALIPIGTALQTKIPCFRYVNLKYISSAFILSSFEIINQKQNRNINKKELHTYLHR